MSFHFIVFALIVERLEEIRLSRRNQQRLRTMGLIPQESTSDLWRLILVHALWFCGLLLERGNSPQWLVVISGFAFVAAQLLRAWILLTLREHWNISIYRSDDAPIVTSGPYRWVRHPNYLVVIMEILFLPLMNGAFVTAILGSLLNGIELYRRIITEEAALAKSSLYREKMLHKARFIPGLV